MNTEQLNINIEARIQEVAGYQTNINNYSLMIAELSGEWSDDTLQYRNKETAELVKLIDDEEKLTQVADLVFKDKLVSTLRTERLEQRKAKLVLKVLQDQLQGAK